MSEPITVEAAEVLRYRAFTTPSGGGNPAGVVLAADGMSDRDMQALAAEVGYSETAFLSPLGEREYRIRYFSPAAEVDFCGHATVATAVALAELHGGAGQYLFHSNVGEIPVLVEHVERIPGAGRADRVEEAELAEEAERAERAEGVECEDEAGRAKEGAGLGNGGFSAALESVTPEAISLDALPELLEVLRWQAADLDAELPGGVAFAGLWHPVLWAGTRERLADLDYDFEGLRALMKRRNWGTVSLLYRESESVIHSRNAFPIGGVVEDPATGAAAAALGGFLRSHGLLPDDGRFIVLQGEDMGQPCRIEVDASGECGVRVSGTARRT